MTENPLEMSEIVRGLPDVPKDLVQSCIDTAQILGIIINNNNIIIIINNNIIIIINNNIIVIIIIILYCEYTNILLSLIGIVIAVQLNNDNAECADADANTSLLVTDTNNNNDDNNKIVNEDDEFEANNDTNNVDADPNTITTSAITSNTTTNDVLPAVKIEESNNVVLTIDNTSIITDFSDIPLNSLLRKDIDDPRKKKKKFSDGNMKQKQKKSKVGNISPIGINVITILTHYQYLLYI